MKKAVFYISIFFMIILGICASAESIRVEGEDYSAVNYSGGYNRTYYEFSNSKAFFSDVSALGNEYSIEYTVTVENDGIYNIKGATSVFGAYYTTDFYLRINDGELIVKTPKVIESYAWNIVSRTDYMALHDFGNFRLNSGDNRIEVVFMKSDAHIEKPNYITIIDYFDFTPVNPDFKLKNIVEQTNSANVFLNNNKVKFRLDFTNMAQGRKTVHFDMYDMTGKKVRNGSVSVANGSDSCVLDLGAMICGWYKIEFSGIETEDIPNTVFFSVVNKRGLNTENSPFGVDRQKTDIVNTEKVNNAIRNIGLNMLRIGTDPYLGAYVEKYFETHEDFYRENERDKGITALLNYEHLGTGWSRKSPDDLFEAYEMNRHMSEHYKGNGYAYEIWNEQEAQFYERTADAYASFFKATAIGISDGDSDAFKMPGGHGGTPDNFFVRQLFRNGVNDYADAYAYHNHNPATSGKAYNKFIKSVESKHTNTALSYDPKQQIWITEAGISMIVGENDIPALDTLVSQARYYVVGTVQQLATGADKSIWFRLGHYMENGNEWGSFSAEDRPYPVINSIAILTEQLKKGIYKGVLNTSGDLEGHLFFNGENDIAVVWTNSEGRCQLYTDSPVYVTDISGKKTKYTPVVMSGGSMVNIPVSYYPVFIEFNGMSDGRNYFPKRMIEKNKKAKIYDTSDRIVLQQIWQEQDEYAAKSKGYMLNDGETQIIKVNVYNFNDTQQSGVLNIFAESAVREAQILDISETQFDFSIAPMSSQDFEIEVTLNPEAESGEQGFLMLSAKLNDGSEISKSIAAFYVDDSERTLSGYELIKNSQNIESWNEHNHGTGISINKSSPGNGVIHFEVTSENNGVWCWPRIELSEYAEDEEGVTFLIRSTDGKEQNVNVYAYCTDGSYWLGITNAIAYGTDWKQVIIPWHKFLPFSGNSSEFDPKKIRSFGIGSYMQQGTTSYEIKHLGFYNSDSPADMSDKGEPVVICGITEGKKYNRNTVFHVEADVNTDNDIEVRIGDEIITDYNVTEGKVKFDYIAERRGYFDLQITHKDKWNYNNTSVVSFYVK